MKKQLFTASLSAAVLLGAVTAARAQTILYQEDWGTTNGGSSVAYALNASSPTYPFSQVGWSIVVPAAQSGTGPPYEGIYQAPNASDAESGYSLPENTVYYSFLATGQTGFFYTTAGAGSGSSGDSAFPAGGINPAAYPDLTLNVEVSGGAGVTNYFAVQVGGEWYVSTTPLAGAAPTYPQFTNACLAYSTSASAWNTLSFDANTVTVGAAAGANLSGNITGVGIVELAPGGWDYNELALTTACGGLGVGTPATIVAAPISQSTYAGGGASFVVEASGTAPLTYTWYQNGLVLTNGGRISGANTAELTIADVTSSDGTASYSVEVSNDGGANTNSASFTLTVSAAPPDYVYAETVPYIGPSGDLPTSTIGWVTAAPDGPDRIYQSGGGNGAVYAYEGTAMTTAFYTTTTNDAGQSGLPFPTINPADYPQLALETALDPNSTVTDVTAYFAVQMNGSNWYVAAASIPENLATTGVFENQAMQFTTNASAWDTLSISATNATIGGPAPAPLTGDITGAGLVFTHHGAGGDFNWDAFQITTDIVSTQPPVIGDDGVPWPQSVYAGGGVSFEVATTSGTTPFTYGWTLNGVFLNDGKLPDGAVVSGSHSPTLTIAGVTTNESGPSGTADVVAFVTNSAGFDESDNYFGPSGTTLSVSNAPVGLLYAETFPWINPSTSGNYSVTLDGWTEAFYNQPASLYNVSQGDGAVFVYDGSAATVAYYTDTLLDTNQSGLPFPNIALAGYPGSLTLSASVEPGFQGANVTAYWTVEIGTNWYVSSNSVPATGSSFATYSLAFDPAKTNWQNLTLTPSGALIGAPAASDLSGVMTGAGLVFAITGSGGDYNFDNFEVTGSGVGDIVVERLTGAAMNLSWVGNPSVSLQSATRLSPANWQDVPGTLGLSTLTVTNIGPQEFYRLMEH